ncbi:Spo0E family sporulation regulatory protein-aspartic acid phosphatase [Paenibacillus tyrfis]|uniref:Spo0E family sporulation regulatory protein-aspartic acid phosphatase n=1 Tax=Paenibacillus tyrfis TaxID=1501230 RepID=UPI00209F3B1D|nr:Spo0E family sporulation regulatory protein-aspartic acid phosphatase [Paenibacillus tyrfis]MCP1306629.1 Spo0E family sporulation regulatory protein-aspartic acid phosphatase [Paenibacillus tyrfis]
MKLLVTRREVSDSSILNMNDEELQKEMMTILRQMEEAVQQGESLTCEHIVRLSQELDNYILIAQTRKMKCLN